MAVELPFCAEDHDRTRTLLKAAAIPCSGSLDAALSRQREDWLKGIRIPIADRLKVCGALCTDANQAAELIYHEFLLQRNAGETPVWNSLLGQFPEYAEELDRFREADEIVEGGIVPSGRSATQLGGYDLLEQVGRGGMGIVYRARERSLDRTVAIKRIRGGTLADDDAVQRFVREAKAVSRLNHPNIVHIYCVGDCDGEPFIALEFVDGPTLGERLDGTPLVPVLVGKIGAAVARAIEHAHQHGIIHRDLKPANILLSRSAEGPIPKVTDFGAAKDLEHANHGDRTQFLGTPSYMAPEQVEAKWGEASRLTDVYGIGTILYEALTGRPPFRADSVGETLRQVAETQPVSPRLLNPAAPRDLETICLKCLQKEPGRRYPSAAALGEDLERFLQGQPIHARPIGPAARVWMWCRRNPGAASLAAILVLALVGGIAGIRDQWRRAEAARKSAVASDVESQELLTELIESNPVALGQRYRPVSASIGSLLKAEAHCKTLLQNNPTEIALRIALTKVYGHLAALYGQQGQGAKANATAREAQQLWELIPAEKAGNKVGRNWLATTYSWHIDDGLPSLQSLQRGEAIWEGLADEEPANLDFLYGMWECRGQMIRAISSQLGKDDWLRPLEESRTDLRELVRQSPADRPLRRRLALTCFLLGEIHAGNRSADKALSAWRESHQHYSALVAEGRNELLGNILLAISCSRLIDGKPSDPYYVQAVPLLERSTRLLKANLKEQPQGGWLRDLLLEDYCCLALCHGKAGQTAQANQASLDCVFLLTTPLDMERIEPESILKHARTLLDFGQLLREANQPAAALRLARQAAALSSQLAVSPAHDPGFLYNLGESLKVCSALANQLAEPALSLQQAELGRSTIETLNRVTPDGYRGQESLSTAWERIAKARWSLGDRDQALAAFRESAAIQKRYLAKEPSNHSCRVSASKFYDRLVFFGSLAGDLRGASDAILERLKLWPDDPKRLTQAADDFAALAERVTGRSRGRLSREDQEERDRYLAESRRARQAAEAASRRADRDLGVER
jgi:tetratricopeptide (TPR) repeat protein